MFALVVASAPFPPSLRQRKQGSKNNLKSVAFAAEHLPPKIESLIEKSTIYLYYFGFYPFSVLLAVLVRSAAAGCAVCLAASLAAAFPRPGFVLGSGQGGTRRRAASQAPVPPEHLLTAVLRLRIDSISDHSTCQDFVPDT